MGWMASNRERIQKEAGTKDIKVVSVKASDMWKKASVTEKKPFEEEAKRQKDAYDAYISTDAGKKALQEKKEEKKGEKQAKLDKDAEKAKAKEEKQIAREKRECKAAAKAIEKDERLKKPPTAYFMWLNDNRDRITAMIGGKGGPEVTKKGSELWKTLPEKEKAAYETKAKQKKEEYDAFVATPEGAAALKAYKEATAAVAYKEKEAETESQEPSAKHKADTPLAKAETAAKKQKLAKAGA